MEIMFPEDIDLDGLLEFLLQGVHPIAPEGLALEEWCFYCEKEIPHKTHRGYLCEGMCNRIVPLADWDALFPHWERGAAVLCSDCALRLGVLTSALAVSPRGFVAASLKEAPWT